MYDDDHRNVGHRLREAIERDSGVGESRIDGPAVRAG
jgi:hypothetical protein